MENSTVTEIPIARESVSAKVIGGMVAEARAHCGHLASNVRHVLGSTMSVDKCQVFSSLAALQGILQDLADQVGLDYEKMNLERYCPDGDNSDPAAPATEGAVQS